MDAIKKTIQEYLHREIPLTEFMGITIDSLCGSHLVMSAVLKPNRNDKNIAFAGSIQALLTICCWSFIYSWLLDNKIDARLFIRRNNIEYNRQVDRDFSAECRLEKPELKTGFIKDLKTNNKARIVLAASIKMHDTTAVDFNGEYVAIYP